MKRLIVLCLALSLLLVGCSPLSNPDKETPVKLTLWHYYNGSAKEAFDTLVQTYNETVGAEKGILIDATPFSGVDALADAVTAAAKGEAGSPPLPNIFAAYPDSLYELHEMSMVAALDPYFTEKELAVYQQDFLNAGRFGSDQELHILPIAKSTELFYLNASDFEPFAAACGVTKEDLTTWEGLTKTAQRYYEWTDAQTPAPNDGEAFFGIDSFANFMLTATRQLGSDLFSLQGDAVQFQFDHAIARQVWDNLYAPYLKGHYASIGRFRSDDTKAGDLLAYVGSTASANYFPTQVEVGKDQANSIACQVSPYPVFAEGTPVAIQQGAGLALAEGEEANKKAAVDFLKWFTQPSQNATFAISTGYIPVQTAALTQEKIQEELKQLPNTNSDSPAVQTALLAEPMINDYELYAAQPFSGSYAARKCLNSTLMERLQVDTARLAEMVASGQDRTSALESLLSTENFEDWYTSFVQEMTVIVK